MHRYHITIDVLETIIRFGLRPNRPDLMKDYFATFKIIISQTAEQTERFALALRTARLLHNTLADEELPLAWRNTCADHIYLCIRLLQANTQSDQQATQFRIVQHQFAALKTNA